MTRKKLILVGVSDPLDEYCAWTLPCFEHPTVTDETDMESPCRKDEKVTSFKRLK